MIKYLINSVMFKYFVSVLFMLSFLLVEKDAQTKDLVKYANTLQGTDSNFGLSWENIYSTMALPYPMHAWSAQTGKNGNGWK